MNPGSAKFCGTCGTMLAIAEPTPDGAVTTEGRARRGAADQTAPGQDPRSQAATATERRVVSILFADLVGFTVLSSSLDPESVREIQDRYFAQAREIVARYGGATEKFIGDAIMAVWGAPTAHEDDAERAVRAALDLVDAVPAIGREAGHELVLRAGVLTGEAAVATAPVNQGMVTGDLVNTAARLQSVAPPGSVLVGEMTRLATEAAIAFEPAGAQVLKGKAAPVPAWRALRVVGERGGARRSEALEPPFVGRADELRFIKEQFHATSRESRARLVSLIGQVGMGKSRLAWELEKYLDGVVEQVWWHRGREPSYGNELPYWALGEMIRRRAGLAEGDDEAATRRAIAAMVARHVPDEAERAWIEPKMLALLGVGEAGPGGRPELFAAWRTFFERLATTGTVVLVVQDLQRSDEGFLDFLDHLLDWARNSRIFVLTLARPELLERRPGWGTDRPGASSLRLDPLPDGAMRELLATLVPRLPEPVVRRILERANGLPLYAVETVRMLVGTGQLIRDGDHLAPANGLSGDGVESLAVPPTLHALVAARLDALPAADRALLQDGAVLGQTFTQEAVAALTGEPADVIAARLRQLVRREILTIETDPSAPARGKYAFVEALVRDVAYGTLARKARRARHLAAARYFETIVDDELAGVVASHLVAAYRAAPEGAEGEAVAAQARAALVSAAARAEALGAMGQAIELLSAALDVARDLPDRAPILERLGLVQTFNTQFDEGDANLAAASQAYHARGDRTSVVRVAALRMQSESAASRISSALEVAEPLRIEVEALAAESVARLADLSSMSIEQRDAADAAATFSESFGRVLFRQGLRDAALEWCDRALKLAEPLSLDEVVAMSLITKGSALMLAGRRREGRAVLEGAVRDARSRGLNMAALRGGINLATFTLHIDPRASLDRTIEDMALARRLGLRSFEAYHAGNASGAAERLGEWRWVHEALDELIAAMPDRSEADWIAACRDATTAWTGDPDLARGQRLLAQAVREGDFQTELNVSAWLARAAFGAGRMSEAISHVQPFFRVAESAAFSVSDELTMAARLFLHAGKLSEARKVVALLAHSAAGIGDHDVGMIRAGIAAIEGHPAEAMATYRTVLAGYRNLGVRFDVALTILDMVTFLGADDPAVAALVPEAREVFRDLGARLLEERLDGLTRESVRVAGPTAGSASESNDRRARRATARTKGRTSRRN